MTTAADRKDYMRDYQRRRRAAGKDADRVRRYYWTHREEIIARRRGRIRPMVSVRPCLCCGAKFKSEGPHNRLCNKCRASS